MTRRRILGGGAALAALGGAWGWAQRPRAAVAATPVAAPRTETGVIKAAPVGGPFALVDHTGRRVTDRSFEGRFLLVFFGFTHCPDVCPIALERFAAVMELLGEDDAAKLQPLLVTVDPERDTPQLLAGYVRHFHPRLVGLTGTPEQVAAMVKAYRVVVTKDPPGPDGAYAVAHTIFEYLMGPDGRNVYVFSPEVEPERVAELIAGALDA